MYDGVVRTLAEVRHLLELKKNHVSMSVMDLKDIFLVRLNMELCKLEGKRSLC